jgi:integrase
MGRSRSAENSLDPATGKSLPAGVVYRGPLQYRARKLVDGRRITTTFETARKAADWLAAVHVDSSRGVFADRTEAERTTLKQVIERYRKEELGDDSEKRGAVEERTGHVNPILTDSICNTKMSRLGSKEVAAFRNRMATEGFAPGTIVRRLNILATIINHARREYGISMSDNPASAALVKRPRGADNKRDRRLRPKSDPAVVAAGKEPRDEEDVLLEAIGKSVNAWDIFLVRWAIATAMRQGETCNLQWQDVDIEKRTVKVWGRARLGTKNGEVQVRPLMPEAIKILGEVPAGIKPTAKIFPVDQVAFRIRYARYVERAGLEDLTYHDLRHEATTRLAKIFPNPLDLMRVTGHKDLKSLARYYHADASELAMRGEAAETVPVATAG